MGAASTLEATSRHARCQLPDSSSAAVPLEGGEIVDDERIAVDADQAVVDKAAEQPIHALPGAADHRSQVRLCIGPIELDATGRPHVSVTGKPHEAHGQPPGEVEEVQLLDVARQPAQLLGQGVQQGADEVRVLVDEAQEVVLGQCQGLRRVDRRGRRGA
jgi:hypothetical protein